jgi:hypothetical protein
MATNGRLRRAIKHARRNGWLSHWNGSLTLPTRQGMRAVTVEWDVHHRNIRRVIERGPETEGEPRKVSIRRAITVLNAEYDRDGNPIA